MSDTKSMKYYSNKQEAQIADALGWRKIGGSGAAPCAPGDVRANEWLAECKTHTKDNPIFFDSAVWSKIKDEAFGHNKKPVLFVDNGTQDLSHTWCLCCERNINQASLIEMDLPFTVRKNISFDDKKARLILSDIARTYVGEFYQGVIYRHTWNGEAVLIMTFDTFKEVYKR